MTESGSNKVVRLPLNPDPRRSAMADENTRRQRLTGILARLVERDVVPRLLSSRDPAPGPALVIPPAREPQPAAVPTPDAVVSFVDTLLKGAPGAAAAIVAERLASGIPAETLSLELLTGAARHLGELWEADRASFADVTLATAQLADIFRELAPFIVPAKSAPGAALLVTTPGEQHSFGLSMLATFFRQAGWTAQTPKVRNATDIQRRVASSPLDLLGLSLGSEIHITRLGHCIDLARRSSCNHNLVIMVGGPVFAARPDLATLVGADATALDAAGALAQAQRLIRARRP